MGAFSTPVVGSLADGLGGFLRAVAQAPVMRQRAEIDAASRAAQMRMHDAQAAKYGEEATGLGLTNTARQAPIDASLPAYAQAAMQLFQATGDTNSDRLASSAQRMQETQLRDAAMAALADPAKANLITSIAAGRPYTPYAKADAGGVLNTGTGAITLGDNDLRTIFRNDRAAGRAKDLANASESLAGAGYKHAQAASEMAPAQAGGAGGSQGALSSTVLRTLQVPALDQKGNPVRNPVTGEIETTTDQDALKRYYIWANGNGLKPTATSFARWEAEGRPGGAGAQQGPSPKPAANTQAPPPKDRKPGAVYQTPKGPMKWTGTGWLPAN